jgi:hypothetical protein
MSQKDDKNTKGALMCFQLGASTEERVGGITIRNLKQMLA